MTCSEARRLRPRFFALELPAAAEAAVRDHLEVCGRCRESYGESEPTFSLAWRLARVEVADDAAFAAGVLSGIRQRRFEQRLASHRRRWVAAAAAAVLFLLTAITVREVQKPVPPLSRPEAAVTVAAAEPPLVDLEGKDVRIYEMVDTPRDAVRVAFVVDPHAEF